LEQSYQLVKNELALEFEKQAKALGFPVMEEAISRVFEQLVEQSMNKLTQLCPGFAASELLS
jgi:hypothetical protein